VRETEGQIERSKLRLGREVEDVRLSHDEAVTGIDRGDDSERPDEGGSSVARGMTIEMCSACKASIGGRNRLTRGCLRKG
jgi:hypothetical protein